MKYFCLFILLFSTLSSTNQIQREVKISTGKTDSNQLLMSYLSRTYHTKGVAKIIQKEVGGRWVELELKTPYPEDYPSIVSQGARENETGFLPPEKPPIHDRNKIEVVFLGFPTWGMQ